MQNTITESKSKKTNLPSHKVETTKEDVIYYLEEMYQMDMLNDKETDIYERYQWWQSKSNSWC